MVVHVVVVVLRVVVVCGYREHVVHYTNEFHRIVVLGYLLLRL